MPRHSKKAIAKHEADCERLRLLTEKVNNNLDEVTPEELEEYLDLNVAHDIFVHGQQTLSRAAYHPDTTKQIVDLLKRADDLIAKIEAEEK